MLTCGFGSMVTKKLKHSKNLICVRGYKHSKDLIARANTVTFQQVFQTTFRSFCCGSVQLFNFRLLRQNEQSCRMRNANRISELWRLPVGRLLITVTQSTKNSNLKTSTRFEINLTNFNPHELSERLYLFTPSFLSIPVGSTFSNSLLFYCFRRLVLCLGSLSKLRECVTIQSGSTFTTRYFTRKNLVTTGYTCYVL